VVHRLAAAAAQLDLQRADAHSVHRHGNSATVIGIVDTYREARAGRPPCERSPAALYPIEIVMWVSLIALAVVMFVALASKSTLLTAR
jgi:hypothetical protein